MATQVQFRGGTTTEHASFNGAAREVTVDTTKQTLVVQDGTTNGGYPLLREDGTQNLKTTGSISLDSNSSKLKIGDNEEIQIYFDGTHSYIQNGTNNLYIRATTTETGIAVIPNGAVKLFYDAGTYSAAKLETTAAGATVNGLFITTGNVRINGTPVWAETGGDYGNLSIRGTTASSSGFLNLGNGAATENNEFDLARIKIHNGATEVARITGITGDGNNDSGELWFATQKNGGSLTTALVIDKEGLCGIGTTSPDRMLHLEGGGAFLRLTNSGTDPDDGDIMGMIEVETRDSNNPGVAVNIRSELMDKTNGACSLFFSAGTPTTIGTKMEIQHNSDVKINSGNLVIGTSGKGIDFSATSDASGKTNELLDEYEEGTWTMGFDYHTGAGWSSVSFDSGPTNTTGYYVRVGKIVNVRIYTSAFDVNSSAVGNYARISGLPFASRSELGSYSVMSFTHGSSFTNDALTGYTELSNTTVRPTQPGTTTSDTWKDGVVYMMMSGTYEVA